MTSLDPSHLPSKHHESRGQAVYSIPTPSGRRKQTLPDLRFEQSYLQSIQPFITFAPSSSSGNEKDHSHQAPTPDSTHSRHGKQEAAEGAAVVDGGQDQDDNKLVQTLYGAPVTINWRGILWVTTRDQLISPLVQGAVWGVAGLVLTPLFQKAGRGFVSAFTGGEPSSNKLNGRARGEGGAARWWRRWVQSLYAGVQTNAALSK